MITSTEKSVIFEPATKPKPVTLLKRIGSTTFEVNVHFSDKSSDTLEDKLIYLLEREVKQCA